MQLTAHRSLLDEPPVGLNRLGFINQDFMSSSQTLERKLGYTPSLLVRFEKISTFDCCYVCCSLDFQHQVHANAALCCKDPRVSTQDVSSMKTTTTDK